MQMRVITHSSLAEFGSFCFIAFNHSLTHTASSLTHSFKLQSLKPHSITHSPTNTCKPHWMDSPVLTHSLTHSLKPHSLTQASLTHTNSLKPHSLTQTTLTHSLTHANYIEFPSDPLTHSNHTHSILTHSLKPHSLTQTTLTTSLFLTLKPVHTSTSGQGAIVLGNKEAVPDKLLEHGKVHTGALPVPPSWCGHLAWAPRVPCTWTSVGWVRQSQRSYTSIHFQLHRHAGRGCEVQGLKTVAPGDTWTHKHYSRVKYHQLRWVKSFSHPTTSHQSRVKCFNH